MLEGGVPNRSAGKIRVLEPKNVALQITKYANGSNESSFHSVLYLSLLPSALILTGLLPGVAILKGRPNFWKKVNISNQEEE